MYLHKAVFSPSSTFVEGKPPNPPDDPAHKAINREILYATVVRNTMKDPTSSKLQIKGPKQADARNFVEVRTLRKQIDSFSDHLLEDTRRNYLLVQNDKRRNLQDFQCNILIKLEEVLKHQLTLQKEDFRKFRIGGHDKGTYEKFFRIEPKRFMSEAQMLTALRIAFGSEVIKSEAIVKKLFSSFDFYLTDQMDWRCFLYLFLIVMQPTLSCEEMLKTAYALFSSVGILDMTCSEKVTIGELKEIICAPVQLSRRSLVFNAFDQAWAHLQKADSTVLQYMAKREEATKTTKGKFDPNECQIPYQFFHKLLHETEFSVMIEPALPFGKKDSRTWSSRLEEDYYHPTLLNRLKFLRRELRNEDECNQFIARTDLRIKQYSMNAWDLFKRKRIFLRHILIAYELRNTVLFFGVVLNKWKKVVMEEVSAISIQRVIRGFLGRRRKIFMDRVRNKVIRLQSNTRQYMIKKQVEMKKSRLFWAAMTIQRIFRGKRMRKKVATLVESIFDTKMRLLEREKEQWKFMRITKAAIAIQMSLRKFLRRRRMMKKLKQKELEREIQDQITESLEEARVKEETYKQELSKWYIARKQQYDEHALTEKQTAKERKKIVQRRMKKLEIEKAAKKAAQEVKLQKLEEEKIEKWIKEWEIKIEEMGIAKRKQCKNCLIIPESPEDVLLKKDIQKRVKVHIKEVLRKADKQKIPMEIPEAFEIATQEIIEEEVEKAKEEGKKLMKEEALRMQDEERRRKAATETNDKATREKRMFWAILTLQKYARIFLARRRVRLQAYQRYEKLFSIEHHEYYYLDKKTKKVFWEKPPSLGSYDVTMEDYWIVIPGKTADGVFSESLSYFYNPSTWEQSWIRPSGTVTCDICLFEFAKINYSDHHIYNDPYNNISTHYCIPCFHMKLSELIHTYHMKPKDILFQEFNGGKTDSLYLDFTLLPVIDYYTYSLEEVHSNLKLSEEEELLLQYQEEAESNKIPNKCEFCLKRKPEIQCFDCNLYYCSSCNNKEHKMGKYKTHKRINIGDDGESSKNNAIIPVVNNGRQPLLQKTSSLLGQYNSNQYDSDEDNDNNLHHHQQQESDYYDTDYTQQSTDGETGGKKKKKKKSKTKTKKHKKEVDDEEEEEDYRGKSATPKKKKRSKSKEPKESRRESETEGDTEDNGEGRKHRRSRSKSPTKTKTKKSKESDSEYDSSPEKQKKPKKSKKPSTAPEQVSNLGEDHDFPSTPADGERKKKKKKKKKKKDQVLDENDPGMMSDVSSPEKKKKKKKKAKEVNDDESSSPERTKFPPINRPNTTNALPDSLFNGGDGDGGESDYLSSPTKEQKRSKSAGDGVKERKKKKPKKEKDAGFLSSTDGDQSLFSDNTKDPNKKKKKKPKKKKEEEEGRGGFLSESENTEATENTAAKKKKKKKKDPSSSDADYDDKQEKKKKKKKSANGSESESELSAMTGDSSPQKAKRKKKKKSENDLDQSRNTDFSSLSEGEGLATIPEKKKKKKKSKSKADGGDESDLDGTHGEKKKKKKKKNEKDSKDFTLPPI